MKMCKRLWIWRVLGKLAECILGTRWVTIRRKQNDLCTY